MRFQCSPCQAVTVSVGTDADGSKSSTVHLYPGVFGDSLILTDQVCPEVGGGCLAQQAGLYDLSHSKTAINVSTIADKATTLQNLPSIDNTVQKISGVNTLDTLGISTKWGNYSLPNATIMALDASYLSLPNHVSYGTRVGYLSVGNPKRDLTSTQDSANDFPSVLAKQNVTPADSFGLTYGSAALNLDGSLIFGGYDRARVLGQVGAFPINDQKMRTELLDITIGIAEGNFSPLEEDSYDGLLRLDGSPRATHKSITISPATPYLSLSPETCAAIAEHIPVTLNKSLGLYTWNTKDPIYNRLLSSAMYLGFIFHIDAGNLTIQVPFQLLNLKLEAPLAPEPTPYFPCQPYTKANKPDTDFVLGRAFLQAAYIAVHWTASRWFLAQAAGPDIDKTDISLFNPQSTTLLTTDIGNFASSWRKSWGTEPGQHESKGSGLSDWQIGVAVCVPVVVLALAGLCLYCVKFRKGQSLKRPGYW